MGIQDNFWTLGNEAVAYGTKAATLTRGYENQSDDVTPLVEQQPSRGMRPSTVSTPSDRSNMVKRGGTVSLTTDLLSKGHGLFLAGFASGTPAVTTPGGATLARLHTFLPSTSGPSRSATIHAGRYDVSGTAHHFDYLGSIGTELNISVAPKGNVVAKGTWNYKREDTAAASVTPAYPSTPYIYKDQDTDVSLDGDSQCLRACEITIPTGVDVARDRICASGRAQPILAGRIEVTGNVSFDYADNTYYDAFLSGETMPLVLACTGPLIEGSTPFSFTLTLPAIQYTGSTPKAALDALPEQPLPFRALSDATDGTWKIEYVTTDTAL